MPALTLTQIVDKLAITKAQLTATCAEYTYKGEVVATSYQHDADTARIQLSLIAATHYPLAQYVIISSRFTLCVSLEVFADCKHAEVFQRAQELKTSGCKYVGVYRIKHRLDNTPVIGALNTFGDYASQYAAECLIFPRCQFIVI